MKRSRQSETTCENNAIKTSVPVPEVLTLKIGANVVLCKNLSTDQQLFNGKMGKIIKFTEDGNPVVKFDGKLNTSVIERTIWSLTDGKGREIASFSQIPLILSYGLTIHKTQGMTLDKVTIHPGFFEVGQAYVAFSRVKTKDGLSFGGNMEFDEIAFDVIVKEFYKQNNLD